MILKQKDNMTEDIQDLNRPRLSLLKAEISPLFPKFGLLPPPFTTSKPLAFLDISGI